MSKKEPKISIGGLMSPYHRRMQDLLGSMEETPEAPAILAPGRSPLTCGQLCAQVAYVMSFLNDHGLGRNDRVAVVLPNGPEMAVAFLGVIGGATFVPLNPAYHEQEYDYLLSGMKARALIVPAGTDSRARAVARQKNMQVVELSLRPEAGAGLFILESDSKLRGRAAENGFAEPDDTALVLTTSGTTSRAKVVPLTQSNVLTSAYYMSSSLRLGNADLCLNILPMSHIAGLISPILASLITGGCIFCPPAYSAADIFRWVEELRPTWITAVPAIHQSLIEFAEKHALSVKGSSLRFIRSISYPLPPVVLEKLEHIFGIPVIETYGLTEATPIASNPLPPLKRKPGSVGLPIGPDIAVMDAANNMLPRGERGEILVRGANVMKGYENNPEANQDVFFSNWLKTGDEGYLDEDGYLCLTGRIKEIINRGGQKVSPWEVDKMLMGHPAVEQAVAFGVPHPSLGEAVAAAVVVDIQLNVTEKELRQYAAEHLAPYKVPQQIVFVESIPKGPASKIQRTRLAEEFSHLLKPRYVPPETETEMIVADIWMKVLGLTKVGRHDNFFAMGGDSLLASQVVYRLQDILKANVPLRSIFESPTVAGLSDLIGQLVLKYLGSEGLRDSPAGPFEEGEI